MTNDTFAHPDRKPASIEGLFEREVGNVTGGDKSQFPTRVASSGPVTGENLADVVGAAADDVLRDHLGEHVVLLTAENKRPLRMAHLEIDRVLETYGPALLKKNLPRQPMTSLAFRLQSLGSGW